MSETLDLTQLTQTIAALQTHLVSLENIFSSMLHTILVCATYGWTPPELLKATTSMSMNFFTSTLDIKTHKKIIDTYLPIQNMAYFPPATLSIALAQFKPHQLKKDTLLISEMQALYFLAMIKNLCSLLIHTFAFIIQSCNELALQSFNLKFQMTDSGSTKNYTIDPFKFQ
ncbi:hypothetical protein J3Q64DRAFT_1835521 [Phycomyces blakesleeanus]|uniref:Uncharacterized protein n=1 Tax=Phycomyces blakesleeanus TaxID=4837 RepID=A0ABR3B179_PHYBL